MEAYASSFPDSYVVDLPAAVRRVSNRETMLDAVRAVESILNPAAVGVGGAETPAARASGPESETSSDVVRAPKQIVAAAGTERSVKAQVDAASLRFPLLAKSLRADGTSDSHRVAIIHDKKGLACVARGSMAGLQLPCVIQEYVNHGGCLFKVYVVGDQVTMTRRKSLPDLRGARRASRRRGEAAAAQKQSSEAAAAQKQSGSELGARGIAAGGDATSDFDGDVDDSEDAFDEDEVEDVEDGESAGRRRRATGAQSVSRVSCFRGGATEGETSWRDRLTEDELRKMSKASETRAAMESPSPSRVRRSLARRLTVSSGGSIDSFGGGASGESGASGSPSFEGDSDAQSFEESGDGEKTSPARAPGAGSRSSFDGLPLSAPNDSHRRSGVAARDSGTRRGSFDRAAIERDGGTERDANSDGNEDLVPGARAREARDPSFRPETLRASGDGTVSSAPTRTGETLLESGVHQKKRVPAPRDDFVKSLALTLRDELRLRLFNFDLIRVDGDTDEFLVVDINYFPGIAKMPGYSDTFCRFLRKAKFKGGGAGR